MLGLLILRWKGCSLLTHQAPFHIRALVSSHCCLTHSISLPLERFEMVSAWEFPNFYPSAIILPAESVMWINSCELVLWLCMMWIFHQIHDYKEGTPEEKTYYIELWDVGGSVGSATSVKSTRAVFYNLLNGKFAWHKYGFTTVSARRSLGSGAEFHVAWLRATLFSFLIYTGKKILIPFVGRILWIQLWMADISGKPVQMNFISLSLQSCTARTAGSLWSCSDIPCRHKGCLHLSRPHILQKYDLYFLVCSVVKPTAEKWVVQFLWTLIVTSYPGKFEQSPIKLPYADNHLASAHLAY